MEEIKIGEYVRFKNGEIGKIIDIKHNPSRVVYSQYGEIELVSNIKKYSKNIIDLIEEGDYVNGRLVLQIDCKNKNVCLLITFTDTLANTNIMWYGYEDIKSIVTKEQFESVKYKMEE